LNQSRSVVFGALVLCALMLILAQRDPAHPLWYRRRSINPWLRPMAAAVVLLLATVLAVPDLRHLMSVDRVGPPALMAGAVLLALCLTWLELSRRV